LIIGNPQPTILHIPDRNNGMMDCWKDGVMGSWGVGIGKNDIARMH
jgi:hypothetical protein